MPLKMQKVWVIKNILDPILENIVQNDEEKVDFRWSAKMISEIKEQYEPIFS